LAMLSSLRDWPKMNSVSTTRYRHPRKSAKAGVQISRENPERAVNVRQIGSVLVELPLQFVDDASKFSTFFDQA
jgi:hypothetical protein